MNDIIISSIWMKFFYPKQFKLIQGDFSMKEDFTVLIHRFYWDHKSNVENCMNIKKNEENIVEKILVLLNKLLEWTAFYVFWCSARWCSGVKDYIYRFICWSKDLLRSYFDMRFCKVKICHKMILGDVASFSVWLRTNILIFTISFISF